MPTFIVNGTEIFCEVRGNGPALLLIPGLGAAHPSFHPLAAELSDAFTVLMPDLRGIGLSARPRQIYSVQQWADDMHALLHALGHREANVLGTSLGGCVAMALAMRHPASVQRLVLAATFARIDPLLALCYRTRIALLDRLGMSQEVLLYIQSQLFGRTFLDSARGREIAVAATESLRGNDADMYAEHLHALLRFGGLETSSDDQALTSDRLAQIHAPALVLCGEEDVLTPPALSRELAEVLPNARLQIQPACGHVAVIEQPVATARLIRAFLAESANVAH